MDGHKISDQINLAARRLSFGAAKFHSRFSLGEARGIDSDRPTSIVFVTNAQTGEIRGVRRSPGSVRVAGTLKRCPAGFNERRQNIPKARR